ncbi:MAG: glycosyltransferase family 2 protein [Bacteroidia bacterium]
MIDNQVHGDEIRASIAAVVVLYNPMEDVYDNIISYREQVQCLYVVDNSTIYNVTLIHKLKALQNVNYVDNLGNQGIAQALNIGAASAIKSGFDYLLTMDQDTVLQPGFVSKLLKAVSLHELKYIGIIAPRYFTAGTSDLPITEDVMITMTSGNLLNLEAYKVVGPFMEKLFIDHVDHEYCLRLKTRGYRVVQCNGIVIPHRPGNVITINFWIKEIEFSSHSPQRTYYYYRNGLYVASLYKDSFPEFKRLFKKLMTKEICKIPLEDRKLERIAMLKRAIKDFRSASFGKLA